MTNGQTRQLAGFPNDIASFDTLRAMSVKASDLKNEDELLEIAKKNLKKHFIIVGLVECFDESIILLRKQLGMKSLNYLRKNVGKGDGPHRLDSLNR